MKTLKIAILSILAAFMVCGICTSCKKGNVTSPQIYLFNFFINSDTLKTDSIVLYPGDTLKYMIRLQPFYDRIESLEVETERAYVKDSIFSDKDYKELCDLTQSDRKAGKYVFKNMKDGYYLTTANYLIALKSPETELNRVSVIYRFKSTADVSGDFNPSKAKLTFTIKNRK
ncbi:MAG: hypothetical protein MJ010_07745 [Paludibacteraceae bacterium]|nr:hypothetical protein [Paludibacteraceae bacterium]